MVVHHNMYRACQALAQRPQPFPLILHGADLMGCPRVWLYHKSSRRPLRSFMLVLEHCSPHRQTTGTIPKLRSKDLRGHVALRLKPEVEQHLHSCCARECNAISQTHSRNKSLQVYRA